jgi:hypothetical protein
VKIVDDLEPLEFQTFRHFEPVETPFTIGHLDIVTGNRRCDRERARRRFLPQRRNVVAEQ